MNVKRLFYNWLQKENCLKQFKYNTKHRSRPNQVFRMYDPSYFVVAAFEWDRSNEGYSYWLCKENKWIKFLNDKYPNLI